MKACGGSILTSVTNITQDTLGKCEQLVEKQVGADRLGARTSRLAHLTPPPQI